MRLLYVLTLSFVFSLKMYSQKVQTIISEDWKSGSWINSYKYLYDYDTDTFLKSVGNQKWNTISSNWFDQYQQVYKNDINGVVLQSILLTRDTALAVWDSTQRQTSIYNNKHLIDTSIIENYSAGIWKQSSRLYHIYDTSGYLEERVGQNWNVSLSKWDNYTLVNYTYDSSGLVLEYTSKNWDALASAWNPSRHATYTYNGANKIATFILASAVPGDSTKFSREISTYDSMGYLTNGLYQNWKVDSSSWINTSKIDYLYLSDGRIYQTVSQVWNNTTKTWTNSQRITHTYMGTTDILDINDLVFKLYPNPSKEVLNITLINGGNALVKVVDIQGKAIISTPTFRNATTLNISDLSSGLYILHLQQDNKITTTRFVKE